MSSVNHEPTTTPRNVPPTLKSGKRVPTSNPLGHGIPKRAPKGEAAQQELLHHLRERVKELIALPETVQMLQDSTKALDEIFGKIAALIPSAWQYPEVTVSRIQFERLTVYRRHPFKKQSG